VSFFTKRDQTEQYRQIFLPIFFSSLPEYGKELALKRDYKAVNEDL